MFDFTREFPKRLTTQTVLATAAVLMTASLAIAQDAPSNPATGDSLTLAGETHSVTQNICQLTADSLQYGGTVDEADGGIMEVRAGKQSLPGGQFQIVEARTFSDGENASEVYVAIRNQRPDGSWVNGLQEPATGPLITIDGHQAHAEGAFLERSGAPVPAGTGSLTVTCN
jgi:hypothetical protein